MFKPNFQVNSLPDLKIKSLSIENYRAYEKFHMDFNFKDSIKPFICFLGDNGVGKTTALNIIQMIFQRYDGYSKERMSLRFDKCIRHTDRVNLENAEVDNFLVEAEISSSFGDYKVSIDKNGFINDHPEEIKPILYRLCYYARFDQELDKFQIVRDKWIDFKSLFESVTGYEIEENVNCFSSSEDPEQKRIMENYVFDFTVKKPFEFISHKECSNGEKKVIKSFSTLLNLEMQPRIILIDDIAMHVALNRHIPLIEAMKKCYPDSQIFSTAHSSRISQNLKDISQIYDLRLVHSDEIFKKEPWRLLMIDTLDDALYKLQGLDSKKSRSLYELGKKIKAQLSLEIKDLRSYQQNVSKFLKEVSDLYVIGIMSSGR